MKIKTPTSRNMVLLSVSTNSVYEDIDTRWLQSPMLPVVSQLKLNMILTKFEPLKPLSEAISRLVI